MDVVAGAEHQGRVHLCGAVQRPPHVGGPQWPARTGGRVRHVDADGLAYLVQAARALAPRPRVAKPGPEHRSNLEVGHDQVLLELPPSGHLLAERVVDDRAAVEYQLVLAADHVHVGHEQLVVGGPHGKHPLPRPTLARVEGRRADVDDHLRPGGPLHHRRPQRKPDILAYVHADWGACDGEDRTLGPRLEVALLVEHPVVRQVYLVVLAHHLAVVQDRRGVVDVGVRVHEPDHRGNIPGSRRHLEHLPDVLLDELRLEQQVLGGIPGYGKLRKRDEIRPQIACAVYVLNDPAGIAVQVADRGVGLGQGDSECAHGASAHRWNAGARSIA